MKKEDTGQNPFESTKKLLGIYDIYFGAMSIFMVANGAFAYMRGHDGPGNPLSIIFFCLFNLIMSQITMRTRYPLRSELFRMLVGIPVFCIPIMLFSSTASGTWGCGFMIMGTACCITQAHLTGKQRLGPMLLVYCMSIMIVTGLLKSDGPGLYRLISSAIMTSGLGMVMSKLVLLMKSSMQKLEENQRLLQQQSRLSAIGEMAGGIAHEINNPLAVIHSSSLLLRRRRQKGHLSDEMLYGGLDSIEKTVERISKIVQGLRTISRSDTNEAPVEERVGTILEEVLSLCEQRLKMGGVQLALDDKRNWHVDIPCQRVALSQAILNLVNNAFDAISPLSEKWIKIEVEHDSAVLKIKVIDSGQGIPPHIAEKLFTPFFTTKDVGKGTGLGLGLSRALTEKQGGRLYLDRQAANTCFVIELPKALAAAA